MTAEAISRREVDPRQVAAYLTRVEEELWPQVIRDLHRGPEFGLRKERRPQDYPPGRSPENVTNRYDRRWYGVTGHCREVTARVDMVCRLLGIEDSVRLDADAGAGGHDLSKADEISERPPNGVDWGHYERVTERADRRLRSAGVSERIIWYTNAMGHNALREAQGLLLRDEYDDETLAWFACHAVDDWTPGSGWATPGIFESRMQKNIGNPQIAALAEEGHAHLGGNTFEVQREVGWQVIQVLAERIAATTGDPVTADNLPEYIDARIAEEMAML